MDRISGLYSLSSSGGCLDRIAGLQDLQIVFFKLNWGLFGQDFRVYRIVK